MTTVSDVAAESTRGVAQNMIRIVESTPAEKQTWKPLDEGRPVLNQLVECAGLNFIAAQALRERAMPALDPERRKQFEAENNTIEKALAAFKASVETLTPAIAAFPAEHLEETLTLPFGGGWTLTFAQFLLLPGQHICYHNGQMNYIQTLYGDKEMH